MSASYIPTCFPNFKSSASSKLSCNSFCKISVYWLPPTDTSRINRGIPFFVIIDIGQRRPDIEQSDRLIRIRVVVDFEGILQRKGININDFCRMAGHCNDGRIVLDLVLLSSHQENLKPPILTFRRADHFIVEVDVCDFEGDVLVGTELNRTLDFLGAIYRKNNTFDDDRVPRHARHHALPLEAAHGECRLDGL